MFVGVVLSVAIPEALLSRGTKQAQECFARFAAPRGPETPPCGEAISPLRIAGRFPWTTNRARYRIEEIGVRMAHEEYVDAAVGKPSHEALARAAEAIEHQTQVVQNGSTRVTLVELGPSVGTPDLGRDADEMGDRQTLLERGEQWFNWRVRLSTLRAALLNGDLEKTKSLAKRYAVDDPRDPDIRSAVATLLCMGPDLDKGSKMLAFIQDDRASRKYEGLSRDYGEVRALLTACLAQLRLPPPPIPTNSNAGSADAVEQRALLRLRLANTPAAETSQTPALATIVRLLEGGPRSPGARLAFLTALLTTDPKQDPARIVRFAKPKFDEPPLGPSILFTALEWVTDHRPATGDEEPPSILPGQTFVLAAQTLEKLEADLAEPADTPKDAPTEKSDKPATEPTRDAAVSETLRRELVQLRGAILLEAAASLTRDGDIDAALQAADSAARALELNAAAHHLLRSNIHWLSGDREKALADIETDLSGELALDPKENRLGAVLLTQASELAMSLGKTDQARKHAQKAEGLAASAKDARTFARARWMLAALGDLKLEPMKLEDLSRPLPFPSMGFANPMSPWRVGDHDKQRALVDQALSPWVSLASAEPPTRRAGRWAASHSRGDAPPWLAVHLLLASRLLNPSEGDMEVWFDALLALDQRRFSLRSYAFARAEAARMRGDMATATMWDERFRKLCKLASEVPYYEFTRHLDI